MRKAQRWDYRSNVMTPADKGSNSDLERLLSEGMEEDMLPDDICGNCLGDNQVQFDARSGRRLCIECEPNPLPE
jgi:hypothetical protein